MSDTKFKPGVSGNPNGRPPGSRNKFTTLKDSFTEAFTEIDEVRGLVAWIKLSPENQRYFYGWLSSMIPREGSITVSIDINKYGLMPDSEIPPDIFRNYMIELISYQPIHAGIKRRLIKMLQKGFGPPKFSLANLRKSYEAFQNPVLIAKRESMRKAIPVDVTPVKSPETGRKKGKAKPKKKPDFTKYVVPEKKLTPELQAKLQAKRKRLAELKKELEECPD